MTLADIVEELEGARLLELARFVGWVTGILVAREAQYGGAVPEDIAVGHLAAFRDWRSYPERLGLRLSVMTIDRIIELLDSTDAQYPRYRELLNALDGRLQDEMRGQKFLVLDPGMVKYYDVASNSHYGDEIVLAFPTVYDDVEEASKCLALGRTTASVFHSMRVLEVGLYRLGQHVGVVDVEVNWEEAIRRVEAAIKAHRAEGPGKSAPLDERDAWQTRREFYAEAALQFRYLKDAWRNRTAHAGHSYTDSKAQLIFEHVGEFMKTLAEGGLGEESN